MLEVDRGTICHALILAVWFEGMTNRQHPHHLDGATMPTEPPTAMEPSFSCGLVWLRRDLRVTDNAALSHALKHCQRVHVVFVFDTEILDALPRADRRVQFIRESLVEDRKSVV